MRKPILWPICPQCGGRHGGLKPGLCANPGGPLDRARFNSLEEALTAERNAFLALGEKPPF